MTLDFKLTRERLRIPQNHEAVLGEADFSCYVGENLNFGEFISLFGDILDVRIKDGFYNTRFKNDYLMSLIKNGKIFQKIDNSDSFYKDYVKNRINTIEKSGHIEFLENELLRTIALVYVPESIVKGDIELRFSFTTNQDKLSKLFHKFEIERNSDEDFDEDFLNMMRQLL